MREEKLGDEEIIKRIKKYRAGLPSEYSLRFLEKRDSDLVFEVENSVLPRGVRHADVTTCLRDDSTLGFLVLQGNAVVGEIVTSYDDVFDNSLETGYLFSLGVLPGDKNATLILDRLMKLGLTYVNLTCFNRMIFPLWQGHQALDLAKDLGFRKIGDKPNFYQNGDNQIVLAKDIGIKDTARYLQDLAGKEWTKKYLGVEE